MGKKCGRLLLGGGEGNGKAEDEKNTKERDVENVPQQSSANHTRRSLTLNTLNSNTSIPNLIVEFIAMTWNAKLPAVSLQHIPLAAVFAAVLNTCKPTSNIKASFISTQKSEWRISTNTLSDENHTKLLAVHQIRQGGGHRKGKDNLFFQMKQPIHEKTDPVNESCKYLVLSSMAKAKSQVRM